MEMVANDVEALGKIMNEVVTTVTGFKDQIGQLQDAAQKVAGLDATLQGMTGELRHMAGTIDGNDVRFKGSMDAAVKELVDRANVMGGELEQMRAE